MLELLAMALLDVIDVLHGILLIAVQDHEHVRITHEGPSARYVVLDVQGARVFAHHLSDGETMIIPQTWRLLVQPIDHVTLHPLHALPGLWSTQ